MHTRPFPSWLTLLASFLSLILLLSASAWADDDDDDDDNSRKPKKVKKLNDLKDCVFDGAIAKYNATTARWECASDNVGTGTNATTECSGTEVLLANGDCMDLPATLADLIACGPGDTLEVNQEGVWECVEASDCQYPGGSCTVFVTKGSWNGDLTDEVDGACDDAENPGLCAADLLCQMEADDTEGGSTVPISTYVAWLSTPDNHAVDRVGPDLGQNYAVPQPIGTVIATSLTALVSFIDHPIFAIAAHADGSLFSGQPTGVWTGTQGRGLASEGATCGQWDDESATGEVGLAIADPRTFPEDLEAWTSFSEESCTQEYRLYCFQK